MAQILSQNEKSTNTLKDFFVPSFAAVFLYFLLGSILLLTYAYSRILGWFSNDYLESAGRLDQSLQVFGKGFGHSFDTALGGRLGQAIVWSLLGALVYILIWFVKNMLNSVENDFITDRYLHPKTYNRTKFLGVAIGELVFFLALLIVLAVYTFIGLKVVMPAAASLLSSSLSHFRFPISILYIVLSVVVPAIAVYVWVIVTQMLTRLWQKL